MSVDVPPPFGSVIRDSDGETVMSLGVRGGSASDTAHSFCLAAPGGGTVLPVRLRMDRYIILSLINSDDRYRVIEEPLP